MTILYGLLVDLLPIRQSVFEERMHTFWNNESRLWATMGDGEPTSRASIKRIIEGRAQGRERGWTGMNWMMQARDGKIIGNIGFNWVNEYNRWANLGAWIGEADYWSGGHGTDGLLLVMDFAFRWLDLRRLFLGTMGINDRAQRSVENCGFRLEVRCREAAWFQGRRVDELMYGLMVEEWAGREALVERLNLRARAEQRYGKVE